MPRSAADRPATSQSRRPFCARAPGGL